MLTRHLSAASRTLAAGLLLALLPAVGSCGSPPAADSSAPPPAESRESAPPQTALADQSPADPQLHPKLHAATLPEDELADGWISLFDGQTLFGWQPVSEADWRVQQGAIVVSSGKPGLLCTTSRFSDYILKLDFRSAAGTNSGVFLRTPQRPLDPSSDCYELNIADSDNAFPTCSLVRRQKAEGNFDSTDWQSYEVTVQGNRIVVKLDGQETLNYVDPAPVQRGYIGLQLNQGRVEFRNIRLKPLGTQPLFNGSDLTGWKTYPEMASQFTVSDEGHLHVENGPGQLETEQSYADFVMQLECLCHDKHLNSGIFFRCIPGEKMNGYESQIHNGFAEGDRSQPLDCGTGGIFRRQDARLVVADDGVWFHKTVIADGPHLAVWINGFQVSDWTDQRPPDENPRKGLRLQAGTIMIQGHDPTTNLSFRNLRIAAR